MFLNPKAVNGTMKKEHGPCKKLMHLMQERQLYEQ